ncbi:MAG: hypothetical protein APF81_17765 [Desulfosporosinus sp. BRH_c37]|nr:MAG: hypothetical protein APF81_17765 [Desulfosporosinus sp. BRH_c37]
MFELRDYQREAVEIIESMEEGENRLICLPCGTGKTCIFATVANNSDSKVLILVPSTELRKQAIEKLLKLDPNCDVGSVQAGLNEFDHRILVSTRQSLSHKKSTRLEKMLADSEFEYIFIDEAHQAVDQIKLILSKLNSNVKIAAFTATPYSKKLEDIFDKVHFSRSILEMIELDYLCPPKAFQIKTGVNISGVKSVAGEFNQKDLEDTIDTPERNLQIVDAWRKYASDRKHTVIFTAGIEHSNNIMDEFIAQGIDCRTINSKTDKDDRVQMLEDFANGLFPILTNCNILTTGFDFPALSCILLASPTKSKIKYIQMIGRPMRTHPGKEDCLILDMKDSILKHDILDLSDVFGVDIQNGETLKEAQERAEEEIAIKLAEQEAKELAYLQKQELIAQEIELFNASIGNAIEATGYYDWWSINKNLWALSTSSDYHYVIARVANMFKVMEINTTKDNNSIELVNSSFSVLDMIAYVESDVRKITSFMRKDGEWKQDPASPAQIRAVKYGTVENKWDVHRYFSQWKIKVILKQYKNAA